MTEAWKEAKNNYQREYRKKHSEEIKRYKRDYYQTHKEQCQEYQKRYWEKKAAEGVTV